jgi:hypothetical protein
MILLQGWIFTSYKECSDAIDGKIPKRQLRLVQAWIELHREELLAD